MNEKQTALSPLQKFEQIVRQVMNKVIPAVESNFSRIVYGRIEKVNTSWGRVGVDSKGYSADIQILKQDLSEDENIEIIKDVPMDITVYGTTTVIIGKPVPGMIARVGFMYDDPGYPFIMSITAEGETLPLALNKSLVEVMLEHTHLGNMGAPTSNIQATIPPGGPTLPEQLQRTS